MEVPNNVLIHNALLGLKGQQGRLLRIAPEGYFEVNLGFGGREHRVLLPIKDTVMISQDPEPQFEGGVEIER